VNWVVADEQRENAMIRVFFMFVYMAVLSIRAAMADPRKLESCFDKAAQCPGPALTEDELYRNRAMFPLLAAAEAVADLLGEMLRLPYELLKQAETEILSIREPATGTTGRCQPDGTCFDTS